MTHKAALVSRSAILSAVTRIAIDSVLGFYKRRIRDEKNIKGQSGAVSVVLRPLLVLQPLLGVVGVVVQRVGSDLRLNPHLHAIMVDGVFSANSDSVVFHPLGRLDDSDIADLLQVIRV